MTDDRKTLGETDHTNPYTDRAFGETQIYGRGRRVVADGGEVESTPGVEDEKEDETLADVEHAGPGSEDGSQRTFDRGIDR